MCSGCFLFLLYIRQGCKFTHRSWTVHVYTHSTSHPMPWPSRMKSVSGDWYGRGLGSTIKWKHGPAVSFTYSDGSQGPPQHDSPAHVTLRENQSHGFEWHLLSSCFQIQTELTRGIHNFNPGADFTGHLSYMSTKWETDVTAGAFCPALVQLTQRYLWFQ